MASPLAAQAESQPQLQLQSQSQLQSQPPPPPPPAKTQLTKVQRTLLFTLHARARDYARPDSRLRDEWAAATVARLEQDLGQEAHLNHEFVLKTALELAWRAAVTRASVLDGWADDFLAQHPAGVTVVHLACGLDSRAWRLKPRGSRVRWIDVDMPPVIALRRRVFPDPPPLGKGGEYCLIPTAVRAPTTGDDKDAAAADEEGDPDWLESIPNDRPALVIMEGLTMYLTPAAAEDLLRRVLAHFPSGQLLFDAFAPPLAQFVGRVMGLGPPLADGGPIGWTITDPEALEALGPRVELLDVDHGMTLDDLPAPVAFVFASLLTLASYIPLALWLLDILARLAKRLSQYYILRYAF